jgi:pimeloyl-ACP methyl ester carboxylesterase
VPRVELADVVLDYEVAGEGDPVVLIPGCGQPAVGFRVGLAPMLVEAGYHVVSFDNRGVAPSSAPPAPYSVSAMAADTLGLLDHLGLDRPRLVGHSLGGWVAELLATEHPDRVRSAALLGSCNATTAWERAITTVERDLARSEVELPELFGAVETLRYLPNHQLQDDALVESWLGLLVPSVPWPNPGRLGQYEACLAWSLDPARSSRWPTIIVPLLVLAFEHDIDSPPAHARAAASVIPTAQYAEIAGASHLAPFTHSGEVVAELVRFFATD